MKFARPVLESSSYGVADFAKRGAALAKQGVKIINFGAGDPLEPTPEFIQAAARAGVHPVSQYPSNLGFAELRQAIAGYIQRRFAVTLDSDTQVIPTTGSKEAIFHLPLLFAGPGESKSTVIAPVPGYPPYEKGTLFAHAEYYPVTLRAEDNYLLDLKKIPEDVLKRTAIVWINYPHNPTGALCDLNYLRELYDICQKYGILLCSDECYVDIYFDQKPPSILQVATKGVLAFHSCSKRSGMTGYRSGFVAGDAEVIKVYSQVRNSTGGAVPEIIQRASIAAWSDDQHPLERIEIFRKKRALFEEFFKAAGIQVLPAAATFYVWAKTPPGFTDVEYAEKLLPLGILISPGSFFDKDCTEWFRVSLVPTLEDCQAALELWKSAHQKLGLA